MANKTNISKKNNEKVDKITFKEKMSAISLCISYTWKSSKLLTIAIFFITIIGGLLTIVTPYIFKLIIDYVAGEGSLAIGEKIVFGLTGILIVYAITRILQSIFWDVQGVIKKSHSQKIDKVIVKDMMLKISDLDTVYLFHRTISQCSCNNWSTFSIRLENSCSCNIKRSPCHVIDDEIHTYCLERFCIKLSNI